MSGWFGRQDTRLSRRALVRKRVDPALGIERPTITSLS
jgi:hypothetical protein